MALVCRTPTDTSIRYSAVAESADEDISASRTAGFSNSQPVLSLWTALAARERKGDYNEQLCNEFTWLGMFLEIPRKPDVSYVLQHFPLHTMATMQAIVVHEKLRSTVLQPTWQPYDYCQLQHSSTRLFLTTEYLCGVRRKHATAARYMLYVAMQVQLIQHK